MRRFDHPSLCKLYDIYDYRTYIVLVLEHIEGGTLSDKIKAGTLEVNEAINYSQDILEALSYMHSLNVIHRDIKSTNIMFHKNESTNGKEVLKLIDFGLVGDLTDRTDDSLIHDKCGTLGYLAPELIAKKSKRHYYNHKVDVFSTGVLLYEMFNGRNPFKGKNYDDSLYKNYKAEIDYQKMDSYIPSEYLEFLKNLIERQPADRLSTNEALSQDIFYKSIYDEGSQILSMKLSKMKRFKV